MSSRDRRGFVLSAAALFVAVFALGGGVRWAALTFALVSTLGVAVFVPSRRELSSFSPLLVLLLVLIGLTVLQLVPLPSSIVRVLSPSGYALAVGNADVLGEPTPGWMCLSLDPPGTLFELSKLLGYLCVAYVALRLSSRREGRYRLLAAVSIAGAAVAFVGIGHRLVGAEELFGLYRPRESEHPFLAPLINSNHLGGLLALSAPVSLGLAARGRGRARLLWLLVATVCIAVCLLTRSRGAAIALLLGLMMTAGLLLAQSIWRRDVGLEKVRLTTVVPGVVLVVSILGLVAWLSSANVIAEFRDTRIGELADPRSKFSAWQASTELISDYWGTGVGRGAFEPAFTRVNPASGFATYSHLENEYLQTVVDWGVPGALIIAAAFSWLCIVCFRSWRAGPWAAGSLGGLVAIAAQNVVDFSFAMPGVVVPVLLVASCVAAPEARVLDRKASSVARARRGVSLAIGLLLILLAATPLGRIVNEEHDHLAGLYEEADADTVLEAARASMRRHPVDYYGPAVAAKALYKNGDAEGTRYLNRALLLHPTHPGLHRLAARRLFAAGRRDQASVEYSLALHSTADPAELIEEILARYPEAGDAVRAIPPTVLRPPAVLKALTSAGRTDVAVGFLQRLVTANPENPGHHETLTVYALREHDFNVAESAARRLYELTGSDRAGALMGDVLRASGQVSEAERFLLDVLRREPGRPHQRSKMSLADVYIQQKKWDRAREVLRNVLDHEHPDRAGRARVHEWLARVEVALGNEELGRWHANRAAEFAKP